MMIFIQLGTNFSDRGNAGFLSQQYILQQLGNILNESALHKSESWIMDCDNWFLNQVIEVETDLDSHSFLYERKFVLIPMNEINSDFIYPIFNKLIK